MGREGVRSYRDLAAWQRAKELGILAYQHTKSFPADERFGLTSQCRRSAVSVACNIAEGYARGAPSDYARFLRIARGSLFELETQMEFALEFGYISANSHRELQSAIDGVAKPLSGLLRSVEQLQK